MTALLKYACIIILFDHIYSENACKIYLQHDKEFKRLGINLIILLIDIRLSDIMIPLLLPSIPSL